jgi:hemerythrin
MVRLVRGHNRASDVLFRWGGEEFVVLVASAGYRRAEIVAENLRRAVAAHSFEGAGSVTISLGVAEHNGGESADAWFTRLDKALYDAKRAGRNRVVVARQGNSDAWAAEGGASALHLVWQEGYECGNSTIDAEHRELFTLANKLIDASLLAPTTPSAVKAALDPLLAHVKRHFADEEAILASLDYEQLAEHKRAHAGLVQRAGSMAARLDAGETSLGAIVEFLAQDVVARHLLAVDRAFFPLFR